MMCVNAATNAPDDSPVLVVVVNDPDDLARARDAGWYRIPLDRAPRRIAADYLAFYQTGAFPPEERWSVRWFAPAQAYRLARRRELIPDEPDHPHADHTYYRVSLGPLALLPRPVPSRRLRRITFIPTTLSRLLAAEEINDLWMRSSAQERLWAALKLADIEAERQYPLGDELPAADFALLCRDGRIAVLVVDEPAAFAPPTLVPAAEGELHETLPPDYRLAAGDWVVVRLTVDQLEAGASEVAAQLGAWVARLGGRAAAPAC
jgi:hypothetical protein